MATATALTTTTPLEEFEEAFGDLLSGTLKMLSTDEHPSPSSEEDAPGSGWEDQQRLLLCSSALLRSAGTARTTVDAARTSLRSLARTHDQQTRLAERPAGMGTREEHEALVERGDRERLGRMKEIKEVEQGVWRAAAELVGLKEEVRREEEEEGWGVEDISGEILRLKLYREFGFTPLEEPESGTIHKVLVRSKKNRDAKTVSITGEHSDFYWSNYLWDALET